MLRAFGILNLAFAAGMAWIASVIFYHAAISPGEFHPNPTDRWFLAALFFYAATGAFAAFGNGAALFPFRMPRLIPPLVTHAANGIFLVLALAVAGFVLVMTSSAIAPPIAGPPGGPLVIDHGLAPTASERLASFLPILVITGAYIVVLSRMRRR